MRLVSYRTRRNGTAHAGVVDGDDIIDTGLTMLDLLGDKSWRQRRIGRPLPLASVQLLAPVPGPRKLIACAGNYREHLQESGSEPIDKARMVPRLFLKPATTVIGPDVPLHLPQFSRQVDWEAELAVIIGFNGTIFGYSVINDISARSMDWGVDRVMTDWDRFFDWLNGKWGDGFAPMGPWLVTADEIADPQTLRLQLKLNGQVRQNASTSDMIFGVEEVVRFAAGFMTLEPGDVIATGTPAGVGHASRTYLKPGDVVECFIEGIGLLRTPVVA